MLSLMLFFTVWLQHRLRLFSKFVAFPRQEYMPLVTPKNMQQQHSIHSHLAKPVCM